MIHDDTSKINSLPFLPGAGEMAKLIRSHNWPATVLGEPESWSSSLKLSVSTLLLSKNPMFIWWGSDLIQFYNDEYRKCLGINGKHPMALGQKGEECWTEIWTIIKPLIDEVINTKVGIWREDLLVPIFRNGRIEDVYWSFGYTPILLESGQVGGVLVTCLDTTEKVKNVRKLIESENRFKNLIRDATVGIIVLEGNDFTVKVVNELYCAVINKPYSEVINKKIFDVVPESEERFKPLLTGIINSGKPEYFIEHPFTFIHKEGNRDAFLDMDYQPYFGQDGIISGVMVFVHDVTEKVLNKKLIEQNEHTIKVAEERARLAVEAANIGTFDIDLISGKMVASNRLKSIFGINSTSNLNDFIELIYPDDLIIRSNALEESKETGDIHFECRIITKNNVELRWVRIDAKVFFDINNNPVRRVGTVMDITEIRNILRQKDDFISIASHELKTPITTLKVSLQLLDLIKDKPNSSSSRDLIDQANRSVNKINLLIDDLLNTSAFNIGQLNVNKTRFNLSTLINECCKLRTVSYTHKLIIDGDTEIEVYADETRISQVLINLINNAVKYAPDCESVNIKTEEIKGYIKVSISDCGKGIDLKNLPNLFDRYTRVAKTESSYSGLGLGLYICAEIIKKHKGTIGVESELGKGSTFWFTLPN